MTLICHQAGGGVRSCTGPLNTEETNNCDQLLEETPERDSNFENFHQKFPKLSFIIPQQQNDPSSSTDLDHRYSIFFNTFEKSTFSEI